MTKKVCVVFGGNGAEKNVSIASSRTIIKALNNIKEYEVSYLDFDANFIDNILKIKPDVVFNAMHGTFGEDGRLPTLLNFLRIPYTHSGWEASSIGMNKAFTKQIAEGLEIPTTKSYLYHKAQILEGKFKSFPQSFLKPNSDGSTIGCIRFEGEKGLSVADLKTIKDTKSNFFLIEEFFEGIEITIGVLDGNSIGAIEIRPKEGYYDYTNKYTQGKTEYFSPPQSIKDTTLMEELTVKLYKAIGIKGVARADFLVNGDDFRFLEINTHPGFTELSLVPKMAEKKDVSLESLIKLLIDDASFEDYSK
jgi:D-alanine-D-alanine ligase